MLHTPAAFLSSKDQMHRTEGVVLTMGYQQRTIGEFVGELIAASVDIVVDVRETPWSHRVDFSKVPLSRALERAGIRYVHAWFAGNPKEFRANAASHRECLDRYAAHLEEIPDVVMMLAEMLRDLTASGLRPCLLCYERHPEDCHRSILLERWRAAYGEGLSIQHLATDGAPRLALSE